METKTYVVCESLNPEASVETDDPGIVRVHSVTGGKVGLKLAMREASRLAKNAAHVAFHALAVDRSNGGRFPISGDHLATRKEGDDYIAIAKAPR